jgi:hypothetical protein
MRERVALASGTLTIAPGPSGGTANDVRLPVGLPATDAPDGPGPDRAAGRR